MKLLGFCLLITVLLIVAGKAEIAAKRGEATTSAIAVAPSPEKPIGSTSHKTYTITLYSGMISVEAWRGASEVTVDHCALRFVDMTGKLVVISGTFIVEEE